MADLAAARRYNARTAPRYGVRSRPGITLGSELFAEWTVNLQRVLTPDLVDGKFGPRTIAASWAEERADRHGLADEIRRVVDLSNAQTNPTTSRPSTRSPRVVEIPPVLPASRRTGRPLLWLAVALALTPPGHEIVRGLVAGLMDGWRKKRSSSS